MTIAQTETFERKYIRLTIIYSMGQNVFAPVYRQ